jgi:stress response protein YsnF
MTDPSEADRSAVRDIAAALSGAVGVQPTRVSRDSPTSLTEADAVIELVEETARIEKRVVETGRVRVSTRTEATEQILRETLRGDSVEVTRVPIDRVISEGETAPQIRNEGGLTIIPVLEEILVEVHIRRTASDESVEVPVTLRRQRAVVERVSPEGEITETSEAETGS